MTATCQKVSFATPEAAERHLARVARSGKVLGETAHAYSCSECGMWHWGHRNQSDKAIALMTAKHRHVKWPPRAGRR